MSDLEAVYFADAKAFRAWLGAHGDSAEFLWVGYHKVGGDREVMTWPQSVDAALCFGWIDGVRKRIDEQRYMIRFSRRREGGVWSAVNIKRMAELIEAKLVQPAGLKAFAARREHRSGIYSYEQRTAELPGKYAKELRQTPAAAAFFKAQAPSYRKAAVWWVISAKQAATRSKRLAQLIKDSAKGQRLKQFVSPTRKSPVAAQRVARKRS